MLRAHVYINPASKFGASAVASSVLARIMFCLASVRVHMNYTCMDQATDAPQRVANRCTARVANRCTARDGGL